MEETEMKEVFMSQEELKIKIDMSSKEALVYQFATTFFAATGILIFALASPGGTKAMACILCAVGAIMMACFRGEAIKRSDKLLKKIE